MLAALLAALFDPATVCIASLVALLSYVIYQRFFSPLKHVPGPLLPSLTQLYIARLYMKGGQTKWLTDLHAQYGPVVRIGPNLVDITDPEAAHKIHSAGTGFLKTDFYAPFQGTRKWDLFSERDEKLHGTERRTVAQAFTVESLRDLEPYVDNVLEAFSRRVQELGGLGLDFSKWAQFYAFDVIGELTFAKRFGFVDRGEDDGSLASILAAQRSGAWLGQVPWLFNMVQNVSPLLNRYFKIFERHGFVVHFTEAQIEARKTDNRDHRDMLSKLNEIQAAKPASLPQHGLVSTARSNILAGADTTAVGIRSVIYYVLKDRNCKARLIAELDAARKAGQLADPPSQAELAKLPFFQACVSEALRMLPPTNAPLPRVVPAAGLEAGGVFLPPGTHVGANAILVHREKSVFRDDAAVFNPDRWIVGDAAHMNRYILTFGGGSRTCLGKNVALMEVNKLAAMLFLRFDMELVHPERDWTVADKFFAVQNDMDIRFTRRAEDVL